MFVNILYGTTKKSKSMVKAFFHKNYFNMNIKHTNDLLFGKTNIESFNVLRSEGLTRSNFLVWTGLRQSVPLKLRVACTLDLESLICHDYYCFLIKQK